MCSSIHLGLLSGRTGQNLSRLFKHFTPRWSRRLKKQGKREQLALIRAHPDLAGEAARVGELSAASSVEQAGVGLDRLSDEEFRRFHQLNDAYKKRFEFPLYFGR